jgi:hypothetical protein
MYGVGHGPNGGGRGVARSGDGFGAPLIGPTSQEVGERWEAVRRLVVRHNSALVGREGIWVTVWEGERERQCGSSDSPCR